MCKKKTMLGLLVIILVTEVCKTAYSPVIFNKAETSLHVSGVQASHFFSFQCISSFQFLGKWQRIFWLYHFKPETDEMCVIIPIFCLNNSEKVTDFIALSVWDLVTARFIYTENIWGSETLFKKCNSACQAALQLWLYMYVWIWILLWEFLSNLLFSLSSLTWRAFWVKQSPQLSWQITLCQNYI